MVAAFLAGAALVHCGNTDFAVAADAGADGAGSDAGGKPRDSGTGDTGTSTGSGSGAADSGNLACELSYAKTCAIGATCCPKGAPLCCAMIGTNGSPTVTTCNATCPTGTLKTCTDKGDCVGFGGSCCVNPLSKVYGACVPADQCLSPAAIKCSSATDCPSGDVCVSELCQASGSGSGSSSGSGSGCVPKTCPPGGCGVIDTGCGSQAECNTCPTGTECPSGAQTTLPETPCCMPKTCAVQYANQCGMSLDDGCGFPTLNCACPSTAVCPSISVGSPTACVTPPDCSPGHMACGANCCVETAESCCNGSCIPQTQTCPATTP